ASGDPFAGVPYMADLPDGWQVVDIANLDQASLDAFTKQNPGLAGAIASFKALPNARLAVNPLLGNAAILVAIPPQGLPLEMIGQAFTAQFQNVPGVTGKPTASPVTLPAGKGLHWTIPLSVNNASGAATKVSESVYLVVGGDTALMAVFVAPGGAAVPQE